MSSVHQLAKKGIRHHLGASEGMPAGILADMRTLEEATARNTGMTFHLAVNYGSRLELAQAARRCVEDGLQSGDINESIATGVINLGRNFCHDMR